MRITREHYGDAASWAQALCMALPALVYGCIYYFKWSRFALLGVSAELVGVRFEDTFMAFVVAYSVLGLFLLYGAQLSLITDDIHDIPADIIWFVPISVIVLLAYETVVFTIRTGHAQPIYYCALLLEVGLTVVIGTVAYAKWFFGRTKAERRRWIVAALLFALIATCAEHASYLYFHMSEYQVCAEDRAVIVGYDSQGRAIEKTIISLDEYGVCTLKSGYTLTDVTNKEILRGNFAFIQVQEE